MRLHEFQVIRGDRLQSQLWFDYIGNSKASAPTSERQDNENELKVNGISKAVYRGLANTRQCKWAEYNDHACSADLCNRLNNIVGSRL